MLVYVHALYALSVTWKSCFARFIANHYLCRGALFETTTLNKRQNAFSCDFGIDIIVRGPFD